MPPFGYPAEVNDHLSYIQFGTTLENSTVNILIYVSCEWMDFSWINTHKWNFYNQLATLRPLV